MPSNPAKDYTRNVDGLIDACFDQLQDLRHGVSNANETHAFAKTAEVIVRGFEADLKRNALHYAHQQRVIELENRRLELANAENQAAITANTTAPAGQGQAGVGVEDFNGGGKAGDEQDQLYSELCALASE